MSQTKHSFPAEARIVTGRKVKTLRRAGLVPANIFGKQIKSTAIQLEVKPFSKFLKEVGESTLLYLDIKGESEARPVLLSEKKKHPVTGDLIHLSFLQVDLKQKVTASVPVLLVGESPAVKDKLGILVQQLDKIDVEALPTDIPENIQLDISGLLEVNSSLKVKDVTLSSKLVLQSDPEAIIAKVEELAAEEVKEEVVATPAEGEAAATPAEGEDAEAPAETPKEEKSE